MKLSSNLVMAVSLMLSQFVLAKREKCPSTFHRFDCGVKSRRALFYSTKANGSEEVRLGHR